jgi:uncharacterized alpha-E superfamily protein
MLSRVADNILWASRYIERAANTARFLEVSYHLNLDLELGGEPQWSPLIEITGDMEIFKARYGEATQENVMHFLVFNPEYPNSIASSLRAARENALSSRDAMPAEMFEEINTLSKRITSATREKGFFHSLVSELCREVKRTDILISGLAAETLERGRGYYFWQLGKYLERADKTSRLLHVKYFHLLPQLADIGSPIDDMHWSALLLSLDAREAYHRTHGLIHHQHVADMIVLNPGFPRAIRFCLDTALTSLNCITQGQTGRPHTLLEKLCNEFAELDADTIVDTGLNEFIEQFQTDLNEVNHALFEYFNASPTQPTGV